MTPFTHRGPAIAAAVFPELNGRVDHDNGHSAKKNPANSHSIRVYPAGSTAVDSLSNSALNSQPRMAMAAIRYIQTSSAMLPPTLPYMTL